MGSQTAVLAQLQVITHLVAYARPAAGTGATRKKQDHGHTQGDDAARERGAVEGDREPHAWRGAQGRAGPSRREHAAAKTAPPTKKTAPAKGAPAKTSKSAEVATADLSRRFTEALARGFSIKHVNDELFPGTSFAWRARRAPVNAERDAEMIKKLTAWLDAVETEKITPPDRTAASVAGGPSKRELASRVGAATVLLRTAHDAKSAAALKHAVTEALAVLTDDRTMADDDEN